MSQLIMRVRKEECVLILFLATFAIMETSGKRRKTARNSENEVEKSRRIDLCNGPFKKDCQSRDTYVKIVPDEHGHELFTNVVQIKQCSGNCNSKVCKPTRTENVTVTVLSSDGMRCREYKVVEHHECKCLREDKCKNKLSCECDASKNSQCTSLKKWDEKECLCTCRKKTECSTGAKWDDKECRCKKI